MIIPHPGPVVPKGSRDPLPRNWRELESQAGSLPEKFRKIRDGIYASAIVWAHQVPLLGREYGIHDLVVLLPVEWLDSLMDDPGVRIHHYSTDSRRELHNLDRVLEITDGIHAIDGPVLVCCRRGETRTGMILGAYLIRSGMSSVAAYFTLRPFGFQVGAPYDVLWRYRNLPLFEDVHPRVQREPSC